MEKIKKETNKESKKDIITALLVIIGLSIILGSALIALLIFSADNASDVEEEPFFITAPYVPPEPYNPPPEDPEPPPYHRPEPPPDPPFD